MEEERKSKYIKSNLADKFTTYLFYASVLIFLVAFNFQDSRTGGWYLQVFPYGSIGDVTFTDSLTGYIATPLNGSISYIAKTINGGDNWAVKKTNTNPFTKIVFLDINFGYCSSWDTLYKTTNAGENWIPIPITAGFWISDFSALNKDTIWAVDGNGLVGGLFRTTNGGQSWTNQFYQYNNNPDRIYMYNKNFGFMRRGDPPFSSYFGRTTNGGFNWSITNEDTAFTDIHFIDTLIGYMAGGNIKKTTDGGLNWINQKLPQLNFANVLQRFSFINGDTIWGIGGIYSFPSGGRGIIYKSTNGGLNWGYQIPDTSFGIYKYLLVDFTDKLKGWAFRQSLKEIHTLTGGSDTTYYTNIKEQISNVSSDYELKQNFPNPFNPVTKIKYSIKNSVSGIQYSEVKLTIYNIIGKEVTTLVNKKQSKGEYEVKFDGSNLSSGIYFYSMYADGNRVDTKKMLMIK